jgi:hypothetical protein
MYSVRLLRAALLVTLPFLLINKSTLLLAQDDDLLTAAADGAVVSKYIWRGQRLTDDVSLQTSGTIGFGGFSVNVWGNMDLAAVNAGDALFIKEDPIAPAGRSHNGLQGKFSEVDYTFAYSQSLSAVSVDVGTIFYTFPERSASLASTAEIYVGVTLDALPFTPSITAYFDVDETAGNTSSSNGVYILLAGGHSLALPNPIFEAVEFSGSLSFVNGGFSEFYYSSSISGVHDINLGVALPIAISEVLSGSIFVNYSALTGSFRDKQFVDPRQTALGTAGPAKDSATTLWGGFGLSLAF